MRRRDQLLAAALGMAVLGFIVYAAIYFSREMNSSGMTEGIVTRKTFVPRPETQITFGQGGLERRELAGEYRLQVRVPQENGREYTVLVDPTVYAAHQEGDHLLFREAAPGTP